MHPEIQPRDIFNFPEFLHYPIRCALAAHDDDLGLFIPARLNIYFSAQGEAEKKNVSRRGSTSGGFNTSSPPFHTADVYKTTRDGTQGIMGYTLEPIGVQVYFVRSLTEVRCTSVWLLHRLHFSSQHIVLIQFLFLMTHNTLL